MKEVAAALLMLLIQTAAALSAERVSFRKSLTPAQQQCFRDMLRHGDWSMSPQLHREMQASALPAKAYLNENGRLQYIFIIETTAFCGTAGCSMLIGEAGKHGVCRKLYSGSGITFAIRVLHRSDHGYRRLYTPCELRFDGREYQQLHDECPTLDVQR